MNSAVKLISVCFLFQGVLCREFSISLPKSVEAVRGLCVLIPCSFDIQEQFDVNLQGDPTGIWLKDGIDSNTVFNSKTPKENKIEGEILGNLLMKNCTTVFYDIRLSDGGDYYFRLEASERLKYTYTPSVLMSVRDSPISPSITLYKEDQKELEVQNEVLEGTSLSLICSARSPPCLLRPPSFSWNFLPEERRPEQNHSTSFSSSQLNFIASHLHHEFQFTCTATYQLQNHNKSAQSSHTLQVLYAPRNTSVSASPSASVLLGSSVSLSCSSDANPAVLNFTWYRENGEQIGTGNHLTINTNDSTHSGLYYCRAQNQHGYQKASVQLDLQYAPQVSFSSSCNSTQDLIMCFCEVDGNPAPTLEWRLSDQTVSPSGMLSIQVESVYNMGLRSFITIHQSFIATPTLQCVSSNNLGVDTHLFHPIESGGRHSAEHGLVALSVVLLLGVGVIGFLLYKIKQLSRKINVLQREDPAPSLELSDFETGVELRYERKKEPELKAALFNHSIFTHFRRKHSVCPEFL